MTKKYDAHDMVLNGIIDRYPELKSYPREMVREVFKDSFFYQLEVFKIQFGIAMGVIPLVDWMAKKINAIGKE